VNFATTESADELVARVADADQSHRSAETIAIDFCVHYVVRTLPVRSPSFGTKVVA